MGWEALGWGPRGSRGGRGGDLRDARLGNLGYGGGLRVVEVEALGWLASRGWGSTGCWGASRGGGLWGGISRFHLLSWIHFCRIFVKFLCVTLI